MRDLAIVIVVNYFFNTLSMNFNFKKNREKRNEWRTYLDDRGKWDR